MQDTDLSTVSTADLVTELCKRSDSLVLGMVTLKRRGRHVAEEFKPIACGAMTSCLGLLKRMETHVMRHIEKSSRPLDENDE